MKIDLSKCKDCKKCKLYCNTDIIRKAATEEYFNAVKNFRLKTWNQDAILIISWEANRLGLSLLISTMRMIKSAKFHCSMFLKERYLYLNISVKEQQVNLYLRQHTKEKLLITF